MLRMLHIVKSNAWNTYITQMSVRHREKLLWTSKLYNILWSRNKYAHLLSLSSPSQLFNSKQQLFFPLAMLSWPQRGSNYTLIDTQMQPTNAYEHKTRRERERESNPISSLTETEDNEQLDWGSIDNAAHNALCVR